MAVGRGSRIRGPLRFGAAGLLLVGALLAAACGDGPTRRGTVLEPDLKRSFVTPGDALLVGVLGQGWALQIRLEPEDLDYFEAELPLDKRVWVRSALWARGPDLETYVHPPGDAPAPPIPSDRQHELHVVNDLWIRVVLRYRLPEPHGYVGIQLEPFHAGGVRYVVDGLRQIPVKGPGD